MLDYNQIFHALQLAVLSFVITDQLTKQGHLLEFYYDFLVWVQGKSKPLAKMLGYCTICFSGQFSFWTWLVLVGYGDFYFILILNHVIFICFTILFTIALLKFLG